MVVFEKKLEPNGATLQCYQQHRSDEIPRMETRPAILIFPGGAYQGCSDREAEPVALAFLHYGYNTFVLRYTVSGGSPGSPQKAAEDVFSSALADAQAALCYIRDNAEELGVAPDKIAVAGFSAGGNLAAALGTISDIKPNALVLGYTAVDDRVNNALGVHAPIMYDEVTDATPPAFLFTTQADTVVPSDNTLRFALALAERKIPYEAHVFATGDHGLSLAMDASGIANSEVSQWHPMCIRFLEHIWNHDNLLWGDTLSGRRLSVDSRLDMILASESAKAIVNRYLPGVLEKIAEQPRAFDLSLRKIQKFAGNAFSETVLKEIDAQLAR